MPSCWVIVLAEEPSALAEGSDLLPSTLPSTIVPVRFSQIRALGISRRNLEQNGEFPRDLLRDITGKPLESDLVV